LNAGISKIIRTGNNLVLILIKPVDIAFA